MGKKSASAGSKLRAAAYKAKDSRTINAKRRLERHLKKHPEDAQAQAALKGVATRKFRVKPVNKNGWVKETLRASMIYVPYLTGKGQAIALRAPEQLDLMLRTHSQPVALTKTNAKAYAQMLRFTAKSPYHATPVVVTKKVDGQVETEIVLKHTAVTSNFKGVKAA